MEYTTGWREPHGFEKTHNPYPRKPTPAFTGVGFHGYGYRFSKVARRIPYVALDIDGLFSREISVHEVDDISARNVEMRIFF